MPIPGTLETNQSSSRKSLIERLATLRIQSSSSSFSASSSSSSSQSKAPESPSYIPRSAQSTITTKSKFYSHQQKESNDFLASPTIGRRRKLTGLTTVTNTNITTKNNVVNPSVSSSCPFDSPKYFPKQKVIEIEGISKFPEFEEIKVSEIERNHSVKEVVTSFIDSFTILNNFLTKSSNSTSAKLHLQNLNTSFAALQMDLKVAISQLNEQKDMKDENEKLKDEIEKLNIEINNLNQEILTKNDTKLDNNSVLVKQNQELEEQLKIALNQISEIKISFDKEKENVEFLQNYMEEIIQLKDEAEQKILSLEKDQRTNSPDDDLLKKENENLKETIKLLEMERKSSKTVCEQAIKVLDSGVNLDELQQELKLKQAEIEKLKGREQHFKESNEIFQQKLLFLTEENRKLRGQRPLNHY